MNDNPIITAIITTYKRPKLLQRAIQSVLNQTYPHFKICVYDDASGDETREIVAEISKRDSRIFYYCNKQNLGMVGNTCQAWATVDTPYFSNLADDDIFIPNHFENAIKGFRKYPEAMFSANQAISITPKRQIRKVTLFDKCREGLYEPPEGLIFLIKNDPSILPGAIYRSEVREKVGYYDPEVGHISDWDYVFRIAAQFPYVVNKTPGYLFCWNKDGYSVSQRSNFFWPQWLKMFQKIVGHPSLNLETKNEIEIHLKNRLKSMVVRQGKEAVLCGNYSVAEKSAQVLKEFFKSPRQCFKLRIIAFVCRIFPPYRWCVNLFKELRSKKKIFEAKSRYLDLQKYASYLQD